MTKCKCNSCKRSEWRDGYCKVVKSYSPVSVGERLLAELEEM